MEYYLDTKGFECPIPVLKVAKFIRKLKFKHYYLYMINLIKLKNIYITSKTHQPQPDRTQQVYLFHLPFRQQQLFLSTFYLTFLFS